MSMNRPPRSVRTSPFVKNIGGTGCQNAQPDDGEQNQKEGIPTQQVECDEPHTENRSDSERGRIEGYNPSADDLGDKHPEANEEKSVQPGHDHAVVGCAEQELQGWTGCNQEEDTGSQEIGDHIDQAEIGTTHGALQVRTSVSTTPG